MLYAVVLPAQPQIHGEPWEHLPAILDIQTAIVVTITPAEIWGYRGAAQSASRGRDDDVGSGVVVAGKLALRIDGCAEAVQLTIQQVVNHSGYACVGVS